MARGVQEGIKNSLPTRFGHIMSYFVDLSSEDLIAGSICPCVDSKEHTSLGSQSNSPRP